MHAPEPVFNTDKAALAGRLKSILPAHCLLIDEEDLRPYECDGLTAYRELPMAVCLPESEGQVIDVLRTCHQLGVPVVARGAGTGLSGGAMPHAQGVVLSLARFNKILRVDRACADRSRSTRGAQSGGVGSGGALWSLLRARPVVADRLHDGRQCRRKLRRRALPEVRPDRAQRAARACHHDRGRGLRVSGSAAPDAPGYDLLALLTARKACWRGHRSDGEADAQTRAGAGGHGLLRRCPQGRRRGGEHHRRRHHSGRAGDDGQAGHRRRRALRQRRLRLDAEAILLCESDGTPEEVAEEIGRMTAVLERSRRPAIFASRRTKPSGCASGPGARRRFRRSAALTPDYYCMDGTIPRRAWPRC
jgi:glycolate oxidase